MRERLVGENDGAFRPGHQRRGTYEIWDWIRFPGESEGNFGRKSFVAVADHRRDALQGSQLSGRPLRIAAGCQDTSCRIEPVYATNERPGCAIGFRGHAACVDDDHVCSRGFPAAQAGIPQSLGNGLAIGARGTAAKVFDVKRVAHSPSLGQGDFDSKVPPWLGRGLIEPESTGPQIRCARLPDAMGIRAAVLPILLCLSGLETVGLFAQQSSAPRLEKRGLTTQLIVDGKPYLILGGELHNSSSSSLEYMKPIWPQLAAMHINTVVTPLSWELIEPAEGKYDFTLVDGLLDQARRADLRIVFLWLASWKNGMSSYAPVWVKQDRKRFPRVIENGAPVEILSPQGSATEQADGRAFAALMEHIKDADSRDHTVLMMQVENEVGVLADTRDHSPMANQGFGSAVPAELTRYLQSHRDQLYPTLRDLWDANGDKTSGTWAEVFGDTEHGDEIFMAWHYARFIQDVTARGKAAYPIPMYVNTWLAGDDATPGSYPSGGPEPWVVDVWKAAGSAIDVYSPDLYDPNFALWCQRYRRDGNPLFMPETRGGAAGAANVFYALGEQAGIGFSPFGIDSEMEATGDLAASYGLIAELSPIVAQHQAAGTIHGFVLDHSHPSVDFTMGGYTLHVTLDEIFGSRSETGMGLIMATGPDEFLGAGRGFRVDFGPRSGQSVGIASVDEGRLDEAGKWVAGRRLNGDENDQGKGWRFDSRKLRTEKVTLYRLN
jgi:Domain of unknown function (DUF5597)/Beta-galactosidase